MSGVHGGHDGTTVWSECEGLKMGGEERRGGHRHDSCRGRLMGHCIKVRNYNVNRLSTG